MIESTMEHIKEFCKEPRKTAELKQYLISIKDVCSIRKADRFVNELLAKGLLYRWSDEKINFYVKTEPKTRQAIAELPLINSKVKNYVRTKPNCISLGSKGKGESR
jgi:hypothetical protein